MPVSHFADQYPKYVHDKSYRNFETQSYIVFPK